MELKNAILYIILDSILFLFFRGFMNGVIRYQLNNSAYKKRKKGEKILEWLLYTRFQNEIPKILLISYRIILCMYPIAILSCVLVSLLHMPSQVLNFIITAVELISGIWGSIILILFWSPKDEVPYERWIKKRRGQNRKRKK